MTRRYKLTGINDAGEVVEVTVTSAAQRERRRGHLEGQGYVVVVEAIPPVAPKTATKTTDRATTSRHAGRSSAAGESSSPSTTSRITGTGLMLVTALLVGGALVLAAMWWLFWHVGIILFLILCVPIGLVIGVTGELVEGSIERRRR